MTAPVASPRASRAVTVFAVAALVAGPPLNYLRFHHYPLLGAEVLVPLALWVLVAIGIGIALNRASRGVRVLAFGSLLLLFVDWQFTDQFELPLKLLAIALLVGVWLLERHIERIVAVCLAAFYVAALPTGSDFKASSINFPSVQRDTALPPVVWIIADEHIGIEGWPSEFAATRDMQHQVRQFYLGEGFRLFGKAYSSSAETRESIPAVLNWPVGDSRRDVVEVVPDTRYQLTANNLFRRLSAEGYRIRVYQSTFLDYCDPHAYRIQSCDTEPGNSISNLSYLDLPLWSKARMVALYFLEYNSYLYRSVRWSYRRLAQQHPAWPSWRTRIRKSEFLAALTMLDSLQEDLRSDDARGTVYFAHLLAPHHPYEVDAACRSQAHPSLWLEIQERNIPAARERRYGLYAGQVACLERHLGALIRMIDSMPNGRRVVVVVHGDHGSRIALSYPIRHNLASLQQSDLTDSYSAMFAIRAPGIPAGYDERFLPIDALAGSALASGFTRIDAPQVKSPVLKIEVGFHKPFVILPITDTALAFPPWVHDPREAASVEVGAFGRSRP